MAKPRIIDKNDMTFPRTCERPSYRQADRVDDVPFAGSGSEMIGCIKAGWPAAVGIERESSYVEIAQRRLKKWAA